MMRKEDWPRTKGGYKKECRGRLPLHVTEPTFLADPTHRKKTFGKHLYALANMPNRRSKVTKQLAF